MVAEEVVYERKSVAFPLQTEKRSDSNTIIEVEHYVGPKQIER